MFSVKETDLFSNKASGKVKRSSRKGQISKNWSNLVSVWNRTVLIAKASKVAIEIVTETM